MVDPIGTRPAAPAALQRVAALVPATSVAAPRTADTPVRGQVPGEVQTLAARPPVDAERVARIRDAIRKGTYPILPETVADRLLALKLQWRPDDHA